MKKILYMLLIAGATFSFSSCNRTDNLDGSGVDAEGNIRNQPVGRGDGAPINERAMGTPEDTIRGADAPGGSVVQDDQVQRDVSTGSGLNPAETDASDEPATGRTGVQTPNNTQAQGQGQRGTAPNTNPTRR
jgi:hypothetical protein